MATTQECCKQYWTPHKAAAVRPPSTHHENIKIRWTRHAGHYWRSRNELIRDVLLWTLSRGRAKAGQPAWTYIQQLCADTGCNPEDLPEDLLITVRSLVLFFSWYRTRLLQIWLDTNSLMPSPLLCSVSNLTDRKKVSIPEKVPPAILKLSASFS